MQLTILISFLTLIGSSFSNPYKDHRNLRNKSLLKSKTFFDLFDKNGEGIVNPVLTNDTLIFDDEIQYGNLINVTKDDYKRLDWSEVSKGKFKGHKIQNKTNIVKRQSCSTGTYADLEILWIIWDKSYVTEFSPITDCVEGDGTVGIEESKTFGLEASVSRSLLKAWGISLGITYQLTTTNTFQCTLQDSPGIEKRGYDVRVISTAYGEKKVLYYNGCTSYYQTKKFYTKVIHSHKKKCWLWC